LRATSTNFDTHPYPNTRIAAGIFFLLTWKGKNGRSTSIEIDQRDHQKRPHDDRPVEKFYDQVVTVMDQSAFGVGSQKDRIDGHAEENEIQYKIEIFQIDYICGCQFFPQGDVGDEQHKEKGGAVCQHCG